MLSNIISSTETSKMVYDISTASPISIKIYNTLGELIRTLENVPSKAAGNYQLEWDGRNDLGVQVANGIYFVVAESNSFSESESIVVLF